MALDRARVSSTARMLHGVALAVFLAGILSTVSLGAYLDLAVLSGLMIVIGPRLLRGSGRGGFLLLGAGVVSTLLITDVALQHGPSRALQVRLEKTLEEYRAGRIEDLATHRVGLHLRELEVASTRPVAGIGLGQYKVISPTIPGPYVGTREVVSGWFGTAAEMGGCGLAILVWALLLARGSDPPVEVVLLIGFALVSQLHGAGYVELTFWYPLAVCAVVSRLDGCKIGGQTQLDPPPPVKGE
jgi:hypothetical protein